MLGIEAELALNKKRQADMKLKKQNAKIKDKAVASEGMQSIGDDEVIMMGSKMVGEEKVFENEEY
jgi:hypothetical protein